MKLLAALALGLMLSGCAAMEKDFVDNSCNYTGGYEYGTNDASEGSAMSSRRFNICPGETREEARRGYMEGYTNASGSRAANDLVDGITSAFSGFGSTSRDRYTCSGEMFGKTYTGTGRTESAAKSRAKRNCKAGDDSIHCHSMIIFDCDQL